MFRFQNIHGMPLSVQRLQTKAIFEARQNNLLLASKYRRYVCPECRRHHTSEMGASECCAPIIDVVYVLDGEEYDTPADLVAALEGETPAIFCPVCSAEHADIEDAAGCCLWKTHSPARQFAITKAIERGESWADAIAANKGD